MERSLATHERAVEPDEAQEVSAFAKDGRNILKLGFFAKDPAKVVAAIDGHIDKTQQALRSGSLTLSDEETVFLSLQLGCLWGEQLVKALNWEWTCLTADGDQYAVASRDRALVILPTYFARSCFAYPDLDCTAALSFNMLVANKFTEVPANSYLNVLDNVVRIVPRH